jgi:hypothetical protein
MMLRGNKKVANGLECAAVTAGSRADPVEMAGEIAYPPE